MIIDSSAIESDSTLDCDVCIVGAGAAGITLALQFLNSGKKVVLLESGGMSLEPATQDLYAGEISGRRTPPLDAARLRYLGGTTNHWAGNCRPLFPQDFEQRDWIPHSGWPISYEDVEPHYKTAAKILELEAEDFALPEGKLSNSKPFEFRSNRVETHLNRFSPPTRFGLRYRKELESSEGLTTILHANLVELEVTPNGSQVTAARIANLAKKTFRVKARAFALACGGIENVRLLLASNSVVKSGLGNDQGLVGRFFMDHLSSRLGDLTFWGDDLKVMDLYTGIARRLGPAPAEFGHNRAYVSLADEQTRKFETCRVSATIIRHFTHPRWLSPAYQRMRELRSGTSKQPMEDLATVARGLDDIAQSLAWKATKGDVGNYILLAQGEQSPNPDSRVELTDERDALGMPRVRLNWQLTELDTRSLRKWAEILAIEFARAGIGRVRVQAPADWKADGPGVGSDWHHMGTTRMSSDPSIGVVDGDCRVHGIANLYVAGSSVFPTGGHSVPTFTIVALAARLGEHLRTKLGS